MAWTISETDLFFPPKSLALWLLRFEALLTFSHQFFPQNTFHCFAATFVVYALYLLSVFSYIQHLLFILPSIFFFFFGLGTACRAKVCYLIKITLLVCALRLRLHGNNSKHCWDLQCIVGKTMRNERAWPQQCWKSCANGSNIVALRFGDHGTKEMLGVVGWKVWLVSNFAQQHETTSNDMRQGV